MKYLSILLAVLYIGNILGSDDSYNQARLHPQVINTSPFLNAPHEYGQCDKNGNFKPFIPDPRLESEKIKATSQSSSYFKKLSACLAGIGFGSYCILLRIADWKFYPPSWSEKIAIPFATGAAASLLVKYYFGLSYWNSVVDKCEKMDAKNKVEYISKNIAEAIHEIKDGNYKVEIHDQIYTDKDLTYFESQQKIFEEESEKLKTDIKKSIQKIQSYDQKFTYATRTSNVLLGGTIVMPLAQIGVMHAKNFASIGKDSSMSTLD